MNDISLSVVIPTYNRKALLKECLESLFAQTYPKEKYEIVVVDDGSTDGTEELLKDIRASHDNFRYFRQEKMGPGAARNLGVSNSNGDIAVFVDSDCIVPESYLESVSACFERNPPISACAGKAFPDFRTGLFKELSKYFETEYKNIPKIETIFSCFDTIAMLHSDCCAIKKNSFLAVKGFDPKFATIAGEDIDLGFRLLSSGYKICITDNIFIYHRQRDTLLSTVKRNYSFGVGDTINAANHFPNWFVVSVSLKKFWAVTGSPFPIFLHLNMIKTSMLLLALLIIYPLLGLPLTFIFLLKHYLEVSRNGGNFKVFILYMLWRCLTDIPRLAGWIVGSIKNGVIYL